MGLTAMIFLLFFNLNALSFNGLNTLYQFAASIERLSTLFKQKLYICERKENVKYEEVGINLKNCSFSWGYVKNDKAGMPIEMTEETCQIQDINLNMGCSELLVIAGRIGSGKTTLLHSLMEETVKKSGSIEVKGKIAYVEQEPFIFSGSVQENITFGLSYNKDKFDFAIKVSQL